MDMQALLQKIFGAQAGPQAQTIYGNTAPTMQPSKFQDFGSLLSSIGNSGVGGGAAPSMMSAAPKPAAPAPMAATQPDMAEILKRLFSQNQPMSSQNLHPTTTQGMY